MMPQSPYNPTPLTFPHLPLPPPSFDKPGRDGECARAYAASGYLASWLALTFRVSQAVSKAVCQPAS